MVVGYKDERGRKKEKEGRGFGRLPYFFFTPFFLSPFLFVKMWRFWSKFGRVFCILRIRVISNF